MRLRILGKKSCHIFWQRRTKMQLLLGDRMDKGELAGVERCPSNQGKIRVVEIITQKRAANGFHVDPVSSRSCTRE